METNFSEQRTIGEIAPPDFGKKKFTIEINVLENAMNFTVKFPVEKEGEETKTINIHEVLGVLEKTKWSFLLNHTEVVIQAHKIYLLMNPQQPTELGPDGQ